MKKVLALIVAFALCFTAFAGCFATSAAPVTGYAFDITAATDDLTSAGGNVVVTVSGKYTTIDTAQYLVVTLPANVEFVSVAGGEDISKVEVAVLLLGREHIIVEQWLVGHCYGMKIDMFILVHFCLFSKPSTTYQAT